MLKIKRVYGTYDADDGARYFVERLWPRGMSKSALVMDAWLKDAAPSPELRRWFGHDPEKWEEFQRRYRAELDAKPAAWQPLVSAARLGDVTLLYAARDPERNSARLLMEYIENRL